MKKILSLLLALTTLFVISACSKPPQKSETIPNQIEQPKESESVPNQKEIPTLNIGWSNELHTGNMELAFLLPDEFKDNNIHLNPVSDKQLELVKDGEVIAYINHVITHGGSECATLLSQHHLDVGYCSSTAIFTTCDKGTDISILSPIQSGGVSIVAKKDAPYNTFEELIEYAKNTEKPILAGYHSPVSSPRIVLEYALKENGVTVTEDPADYNADVFITDLKGLANLVPSLSSGQVELWAGPIPNPQIAEKQGVGKIISTLDALPGGNWVDFPCCTMNVLNSVKEEYPEIISALAVATNDLMNFANTERAKTADAIASYVGMEKEDLLANDTTYTTDANDKFINGMKKYYQVMTDMGKFDGRFKGKSFDEIEDILFDFEIMREARK